MVLSILYSFYSVKKGLNLYVFIAKKWENERKNILDNHFKNSVICIYILNIQRKIRWEMWKILLSKVKVFTIKSGKRSFYNVKIRIFHIIHKVFHTLKALTFTKVFNVILGKICVIFML